MLKSIFTCKTSILFIAALLFVACNNDKYVKSYRVYKGISLEKSSESEVSNQGFDWVKPESWIKFEGSSMRLASFHVPYSYGLGELSVFVLDGDGGGVIANVNRWRGQIGLPSQSLIEINTSADNKENDLGQYQIFKIINRVDFNQAFICAIMPLESRTIFVKLNIEKIGINEVENDFLDFCQSFKLIGK